MNKDTPTVRLLTKALEKGYHTLMRKLVEAIVFSAVLMTPVPVLAAGAGNFTLVNATGADISGLSIRRFGTQPWKTLPGAVPAGGRQGVSFSDPDCAFDLRATLSGGASATWSGVNLCEVRTVILNRNAGSGATWTDYE